MNDGSLTSRRLGTAGLLALTSILTLVTTGQSSDVASSKLRRPLALGLDQREQCLYAANRCGSLSVIDLATQKVVGEIEVGERLSAICRLPDNRWLVADEGRHEVVLLELDGARGRVLGRVAVSPYPVRLCWDEARQCVYVSSLWSRRISRVEYLDDAPRVVEWIDLDLPPRELLLSPGGQQLIAGDAFGGRLAVLRTQPLQVTAVRSFPGHNIRGLAPSQDKSMLVVAHQMLNDLAHTTRNDVHWGLLMSNDLRWLRFDSVLTPDKDLYAGAHMHPLGEAGNATGDPSGLAMTAQGVAVVTLGGVGEVAMGRESDFSLYRVKVGKRPTAVVVDAAGDRAYVANTLGDSVSVIDLKQRATLAEISLGPMPPLSLEDQGESLFYDATLSHDGWMSCHSCHTDGHTNGGLNDNFSDHSFGAPKRVLSLLGCADTAPYAWLGGVERLETQVNNSVNNTMQGDRPLTASQTEALVAYLRTLRPVPSVDQLRGTEDTAAIARGRKVFERLQCGRCHTPPYYTSGGAYDVGLEDARGNKQFNPPSLRGVGHRAPYFHDNHIESLEDVFRVEGHQLDDALEDADLHDLVRFLRSL